MTTHLDGSWGSDIEWDESAIESAWAATRCVEAALRERAERAASLSLEREAAVAAAAASPDYEFEH